MLLLGCHTIRTCFLFTVLIVAVISHPFPAEFEEETYSKDSNVRAAAEDDDHDDSKGSNDDEVVDKDPAKGDNDSPEKLIPRMKAESSITSESRSEEERGSEEESSAKEKPVKQKAQKPLPDIVFSAEHKPKSASDEDDNNDDVGAHSTKRLGADEYEPELRRLKRAVVDSLNLYKSKHKKAHQVSSKPQPTTLQTFI